MAKRSVVPKPNNLQNNKVNNIIVAERQSASNFQTNHSNHVVNHLQQLPMEQPTQLPNNSVQDHLISRLSDQVRGLEDKQDIVKKGWLFFQSKNLKNSFLLFWDHPNTKIAKTVLLFKIKNIILNNEIVRCPSTCDQDCIDFIQFNRCMNKF